MTKAEKLAEVEAAFREILSRHGGYSAQEVRVMMLGAQVMMYAFVNSLEDPEVIALYRRYFDKALVLN